MGIKIGIDPSGTGTTAIVIYLKLLNDNAYKINERGEFTSKNWREHFGWIKWFIMSNECLIYSLFSKYIPPEGKHILNFENCLYTNANGSKDRDDLLRLLGALEKEYKNRKNFNWISPKYTKSVVKNIENLSKYNDNCLWKYEKDNNLTYQYGKGWKYNNDKISNHLRDAIIIANYEN